MSQPISLSDESLTSLTQMLRPLQPAARVAFMSALAEELQYEAQPVGDGVLHRCAVTLLKSGMFKREGAFVLDNTGYGSRAGIPHKPYVKRRRA
jgi:hypothetical protein